MSGGNVLRRPRRETILEQRIQDTEYRIQNGENEIQNAEYRIQYTEWRNGIQDAEFRKRNNTALSYRRLKLLAENGLP